eukprot:257423_1
MSVEDPTTPPIHHQTTFELLKTQRAIIPPNTTPLIEWTRFFFQSTVSIIRFDQTEGNLISTHHIYSNNRYLCGSHEVQTYIVEVYRQNHTFYRGSNTKPFL